MSKTFEKITKEELCKELQWHFEQDAIIQGTYGEGEGEEFQGCMMGCAANSIMRSKGVEIQRNNHSEQAEYLGLPEWFIHLYEFIFERSNKEESKQWVIDCFNSIPNQVDTEKINQLEIPTKVWILTKTKAFHENKDVHTAVDQVIEALQGNGDLNAAESAAWSAARSAAWSAAWSAARSAARSATWSAESAARSAAWSAAWSAARSAARSATWSAESAARSATWSAESAARSATWSAESAARSATWSAFVTDLKKFVLTQLKEIK